MSLQLLNVLCMGIKVRELRHFSIVLSAELTRLFAYRVQFWFELVVSSLVQLGVALVVWRAVFEASGEYTIQGYSFDQMIIYVVIATFIGQAVRGSGTGTFARDIYDGAYTRYLIYPLSVYSYKFATFFARTTIALGQLMLAFMIMFIFDLFPANSSVTPITVLLGLIVVVLASWVYFLMLVTVESVAFWADQAWSMSVMMNVCIIFFGGKLIPVDMFPDWLQTLLAFSPFPLLIFAPIKIMQGDLSSFIPVMATLIGWSLLTLLIARLAVRRGTMRYSGVGI